MENLSPKNISLTIIGGGVGYLIGTIFGILLGYILWSLVTLIYGEFAFDSWTTVISHGSLSIILGVLLALLITMIARKLFGMKMSPLIWGTVAAILAVVAMFNFGARFIFEDHGRAYDYIPLPPEGLDLSEAAYRSDLLPGYRAQLHYGTITGQMIGSPLGAIAGLWIAFHETIGRKRKQKDRQEFDEYSRFFDEHLKK
jgi:hypothetical protein